MNIPAVVRTIALVAATLVLVACSGAGGSPGATEPSPPDQGQVSTNDPILVDPNPGSSGEVTVPQPGQLDVHPVSAESIEAAVDGQTVRLKISWTSGIEPCYVLDSIVVDQGEHAFAITLLEGHAPGDNVCIEIAKSKFAIVDLGELAPGTYTISDATGGAAPIEVIVG
jgi:hypothetical protein